MMKLYYHNFEWKFPNGLSTYIQDFDNVIIPEIAKHVEFVDKNQDADAVLLHLPYSNESVITEHKKVIAIGHNTNHNFFKYKGEHIQYITHYKYFEDIYSYSNYKMKYIPMSIDMNRIRKVPICEKTKDFVYYQHPYLKKRILKELLHQKIEFDDMPKSEKESIENGEALKLLSEYKIVLTVGRGALEAFALGSKVIVVGKQYGGPVLSEKIFNWHRATNFDSTFCSSMGKIKRDLELLSYSSFSPSIDVLDMKTYINEYLDVILS